MKKSRLYRLYYVSVGNIQNRRFDYSLPRLILDEQIFLNHPHISIKSRRKKTSSLRHLANYRERLILSRRHRRQASPWKDGTLDPDEPW